MGKISPFRQNPKEAGIGVLDPISNAQSQTDSNNASQPFRIMTIPISDFHLHSRRYVSNPPRFITCPHRWSDSP